MSRYAIPETTAGRRVLDSMPAAIDAIKRRRTNEAIQNAKTIAANNRITHRNTNKR